MGDAARIARQAAAATPLTRLWFDTEFIESGWDRIDLLSIGVVRDDGAEYYAEVADVDLDRAGLWVRMNVLPHMKLFHDPESEFIKPRRQIAEDLRRFAGANPQWWAWYGAYDWVVLAQLYGRMVDLPRNWPQYVMDVKQLCVEQGDPRIPVQKGREHHALDDARWTRDVHLWLEQQ